MAEISVYSLPFLWYHFFNHLFMDQTHAASGPYKAAAGLNKIE